MCPPISTNKCPFSTLEKQAVLIALCNSKTPESHNDAKHLKNIIKKLKLIVDSELEQAGAK